MRCRQLDWMFHGREGQGQEMGVWRSAGVVFAEKEFQELAVEVLMCQQSTRLQYFLMGCANSSSDQNCHVCCPPGSWPALQVDYTPKGRVVDVGGLKVYEIGSGRRALVLFEDIFGIESGRHKIIADTYANLGFTVFLPQFLEPVYQGSIEDIPKILEVVQQQKMEKIKAKYEKLTAHTKSQGFQNFVAAGYCWGAWAAFRMSAEYNNIKAIAAVHPSLNVEKFYGGDETRLVQSVKCPVFFYSCSNDQPGTKKGGEYVRILTERFGNKAGTEEFPDEQHGFLMRADPSSANVKRDIEKIIKSSMDYFQSFD